MLEDAENGLTDRFRCLLNSLWHDLLALDQRTFADVSFAYPLWRGFFGAFHQGKKKAAQVENPCAAITSIRKEEEFRYRFIYTLKLECSLLTTSHPRKKCRWDVPFSQHECPLWIGSGHPPIAVTGQNRTFGRMLETYNVPKTGYAKTSPFSFTPSI